MADARIDRISQTKSSINPDKFSFKLDMQSHHRRVCIQLKRNAAEEIA